MNILLVFWVIAVVLFLIVGRSCYRLDRNCGLAFLLGFLALVPASLYIASELWILAFG
jgi:hypothetical protein